MRFWHKHINVPAQQLGFIKPEHLGHCRINGLDQALLVNDDHAVFQVVQDGARAGLLELQIKGSLAHLRLQMRCLLLQPGVDFIKLQPLRFQQRFSLFAR